jgi:hypothetical protein
MIVMLKNAAPPRRPLFDPNTAHFQLKNFIFRIFCSFLHLSFFKNKKLATPLDYHDITALFDNF